MKILSVTLKNLNSLRGLNSISLEKEIYPRGEIFAIVGPTGSGKSTLLDAMTLALYGTTPRLQKSVIEMISTHEHESLAEVEFENQGIRYLSHWSLKKAKNPSPKMFLTRWNNSTQTWDHPLSEGIKKTADSIEEITGLDFKRFSRSILLAQGQFAAFLHAPAKERSDLLEKITGTEIYTRLSQFAYRLHREQFDAIKRLDTQLETIQQQLSWMEERSCEDQDICFLEQESKRLEDILHQKTKATELLSILKRVRLEKGKPCPLCGSAQQPALEDSHEAQERLRREAKSFEQAALAWKVFTGEPWREEESAELESKLRAGYRATQAEWSHVQKELGVLTEKITSYQRLKDEAKEILNQKTKIRVNQQKWEELNTLIGSADGQKFRKIAQSLTLEYLLALANLNLQQLTDRYLLCTDTDEECSFQIKDLYWGDSVRSIKTLSGGETFLISLGLALGLSDLASEQTSIDSLFLDEGFGSLDDKTLDHVLTALEGIRAQGKTIGVISHVDAMKERIPVQIIVEKTSVGTSSLRFA